MQDVVASLAADKNVWDAVMKNEKVMEFYRTQQSGKHLFILWITNFSLSLRVCFIVTMIYKSCYFCSCSPA